MKISNTHKEFADLLNNPRALEYPEDFLGPNWKDVLNFWIYLDTLSDDQWSIIESLHVELGYPKWNEGNLNGRQEYWHVVANSAYKTIREYAGYAALAASGDYHWTAASDATYELIGSHKLKEQGKPLTFLPLFNYQPSL
jgi:hypothetical protein